jgi:histidine ammonia-lyase
MCASQGIDYLAPLKPSEPLQKAHSVIRNVVSKLEDDRPLSPDIAKIKELLSTRSIISAVESVTGPLFEN